MIVYHGSSEVVRQPDILHSYRALDFGKGFYVTTVSQQAERWARRKAALVGGRATDTWGRFSVLLRHHHSATQQDNRYPLCNREEICDVVIRTQRTVPLCFIFEQRQIIADGHFQQVV